MIGIGIDTGGTCTDAVVYEMDSKKILATGKTLTTKSNLETGISAALSQLPEEYIKKAEGFALSTTLATNACVENKGSRAKLIIIGTTEEMIIRLTDILDGYGISDTGQIIVLDAKAENLFSQPYDPDWDELRRRAPEMFADCDCVGIVQTYPDANGGRFEMTALRILREELTIPLTIAYDITKETDVLRVCASTLLNARLIPLIAEFMGAVHNVMDERGLNVPLMIVRSDGTLMSEEMARTCPVETLLCGPAASVIGGSELAGAENAILVDMGGTTTDLAIVKDSDPVMASSGIMIGQYKTTIKGLDARAVSLGGDTAVRYRDRELFLDTVRVIPISTLADKYRNVLPDLRRFIEKKQKHTRWPHEFYVLQKDISEKTGYTEHEHRICEALRTKPLITQELVKRIGGDLYHLGAERLEQEGVIIRSGLTPTDIMVIKGDFKGYDDTAARAMLEYFALNLKCDAETIPDRVYELVTEKMYKSVAAFIMHHQYPEYHEYFSDGHLDKMLDSFYKQACMKQKGDEAKIDTARMELKTPMPLVGIGAPIHVFLKKVAELLGTKAVIPEHAEVANALGAIAGRRIARAAVEIEAKYNGYSCTGYTIVTDCRMHMITDLDEAVAFGMKVAEDLIKKRAAFQGLGDDPVMEFRKEEKRIGNKEKGLLLEVVIHATAKAR